MASKQLLRVYSDRNYRYTTSVRHQGTTVAFAMDDRRRIYYSVLNLEAASRSKGEIDSAYWADNPTELAFPAELVDVMPTTGDTAELTRMPMVKWGGRAELSGVVQPGETDPFLSTTARLGAQAPFQVVSDGRYLLVFRQAVAVDDADNVWKLTAGGVSGNLARPDTDWAKQGAAKVPLVSKTVLCDRYVLAGAQLRPVLEVRYQRSRSRTTPASASDGLGTRDMDGNAFYEPTHALSFVREISGGRFTVLLLPTQVDGLFRWQFFAANDKTGRIEALNVERGEDGLFNVAGTQFYTSPDPRFARSVLERQPGDDPFTKKPLVPVPMSTDRAGTALRFDGTSTFIVMSGQGLGLQTVEAWVNPAPGATTSRVILARRDISGKELYRLGLDAKGALVLKVGTAAPLASPDPLPAGRDTHVAAVLDGTTASLYLNGTAVASRAVPYTPAADQLAFISIGASQVPKAGYRDFFSGTIDEVRVWSQPRPARDLARDQARRLAGVEPGLAAYYRFDEGSGTTVRDHTDSPREGSLSGTVEWVASTAPVGDSPGLSRESFTFEGRSVVSGLASVLYSQQEDVATGYAEQPQPSKRQARVLLACATTGPTPGGVADRPYLAALDVAVASDGRLALLPQRIALSAVNLPAASKQTEAISAAQQEVRLAQGKLSEDQRLADAMPQTLETLGMVGPALDKQLRDNGWLPGLLYGLNPRWQELVMFYEGSALRLIEELVRQQDAQGRLGAERLVLADKQAALAALTDRMQGGDEVALPMPWVATDRLGLSVLGGVLTFAWTKDTPVLLESTTGDVALYFRGGDEQFFAAYYDVRVSRLVKEIPLKTGRLRLTSRDTGLNLPDLDVVVSDGPDAARCTVVVTCTQGGQTSRETFTKVPRRADHYAAVLNGTPPVGVLLGTVAKAQGDSVVLAAPLTGQLAAGTPVAVGQTVCAVRSTPAPDQLILTESLASPPSAGTEVRAVVYDYTWATASRPGVRLNRGSLLVAADIAFARDLVAAATGTATSAESAAALDLVPNGTAAGKVAGEGCHWHSNAPGRAFAFDGLTQRLTLPAAQLTRAAMPGDLTVEAWANPTFAGPRARIVQANIPAAQDTTAAQYTLGVADAQFQTALSFDGASDYLDCGTKLALAGTDFTVELWARRPSAGRMDYLLTQNTQNQTAGKSLHIGFRETNQFTFDFWGDGMNTAAPSDSRWHHWACTYERATGDRVIYRDGQEVLRGRAKGQYTGSGQLVLGAIPVAGSVSKAKVEMDEVRIWGRARTGEEVRTDYSRRLTGQEAGLLAYWSFPGRQTSDLSKHGHDATPSGNPKVVVSGVRGYQILAAVGDQLVRSRDTFPTGQWDHLAVAFTQNWATRFDGTSWLDAGNASDLNLVGALTIVAFVKLDTLGVWHGVVSKGVIESSGAAQTVPYALYVQPEGELALMYESGGTLIQHRSTTKLQAGVFYKVGVTRKPTSTGFDIRFSINGRSDDAIHASHSGPQPAGNDAPVEIGRCRWGLTPEGLHGLRGVLSEVRIWNVVRDPAQIGAAITTHAEGLVAQWQFPEHAGNITADSTEAHPARLHGGVRWVKSPDPAGNRFALYHNGDPTAADLMGSSGIWGPDQVTIGGRATAAGGLDEAFNGTLDEIRVWQTARTEEQILDHLFTRLHGEAKTDDLVAYYPFDADSTVAGTTMQLLDRGLRGLHLAPPAAAQAPQVVVSTAPISPDSAEVRSALTGVRTAFNQPIGAAPGVTEYADIQRLPGRGIRGVLKRCYTYQQGGRWHLVTGYKIGTLLSEWVGQAQFDPQLIGYIEGAPPVPSENLVIKPGDGDYKDTAKVTFEQADEVTNTLSSSRENSMETAAKVTYDFEGKFKAHLVVAPLGFGTANPVTEVTVAVNASIGMEYSNAWSSDTQVSEGRNLTRASSVALTGSWEDPNKQANPVVGRRWVPANLGFAVVQSDTADVYALRLEHNRALVAYRMVPNPDIPRDWNLIKFKINPRYTKQGTLDGVIGNGLNGRPFPDPDYPDAGGGVQFSYYKPREAYALKRRIERQEQQLRGFYESVSTETHAADPTFERANKVLADMGGPRLDRDTGRGDTAAAGARAIQAAARRNLANTYLWTAEGGYFAETTSTTDVVTQTTAGKYSVKGTATFGASAKLEGGGISSKFGFELSMSGGSSVTRTRKKESKQTFKIDVSCTGGQDLLRYVDGKLVYEADGTPKTVPGRVDAYRFMTFYLDTTKDNFDDFFGKVVDPDWLATDPQAASLRQANQTNQKPPCWRILHRVTFVSRLLDPDAGKLQKEMRAAGLRSDYDLITKLGPHVTANPANLANLANLTAATTEAVTTHLYPLTPYIADITKLLADYLGVPANPTAPAITPGR
ncbi:MAG TPA: LamG domain-containing protein [Mycobacteriales bacterium]|nr:LamG domain-containing protein [Mycobacteriales bacterium]